MIIENKVARIAFLVTMFAIASFASFFVIRYVFQDFFPSHALMVNDTDQQFSFSTIPDPVECKTNQSTECVFTLQPGEQKMFTLSPPAQGFSCIVKLRKDGSHAPHWSRGTHYYPKDFIAFDMNVKYHVSELRQVNEDDSDFWSCASYFENQNSE